MLFYLSISMLIVSLLFGEANATSSKEICRNSAKEGNKTAPMKVDTVTILAGMTCESTTLVYNFKISNSYAREFNNNRMRESATRSGVCSDQAARNTFFKNGVSLKYSYKNEAGIQLLSFVVTPRDCGL